MLPSARWVPGGSSLSEGLSQSLPRPACFTPQCSTAAAAERGGKENGERVSTGKSCLSAVLLDFQSGYGPLHTLHCAAAQAQQRISLRLAAGWPATHRRTGWW